MNVLDRYTVEECRRKWKNLRDTYHQYRLRKPKIGDGLSKWRYAKDMEFLSNVYQPKLKSNRTQNFNTTTSQDNLLHSVSESNDEHDQVVHQDMVHTGIISVNDADTFILTAYEDVTHDNVNHEDPNMSHGELNHDNNSMEDCVEIVKHEQHSTLDDDGNTGAEVDYEEVCLYEESGNTPSVDCETIIGAPGTNSANSDDTKFQYIDTNDFCIASMNPTRSQYSSSASSVIGASGTLKLKSLPMVTSSTTSMPSTSSNTTLDSTTPCVSIASSAVHIQQLPELTPSPSIPAPVATTTATSSTTAPVKPDSNSLIASSSSSNTNTHPPPPPNYSNHNNNSSSSNMGSNNAITSNCTVADYCNHQREECDLFFDFLKKKIQRFPPEEITSIQVEFLNCVLRREAEHAQKAQQQQHQQQNHHQQHTSMN